MSRFRPSVVLFILASLAQPCAGAADPESARTIEFGGLRNAQATVSVDSDEYTVAAVMLPVRVFDEATNREINRRFLTHIAFDGLRQILTDESAVLTVSGALVSDLETTDEVCRLTVQVPVNGIEVHPAPASDASGQAEESSPPVPQMIFSLAALQSGLLERQQEYADLLDGLVAVLQADVHSLPAAPDGKAEGDDPSTPDALTQRTTALFEALARHIERDLMLLSFEKQSLLDDLRTREQQLLTAIRAAASSRPAPTPPENDHDADPAPVLDHRGTER